MGVVVEYGEESEDGDFGDFPSSSGTSVRFRVDEDMGRADDAV